MMNVFFIIAGSFNTLCRQKDVEIFVVFMKNLNIQLNKTDKTFIDSKIVISIKYHDFLNVFFKDKTNELTSHKKHYHRIELKNDKKKTLRYAFLYNIFERKLLFVKQYLQEHLDKKFIESNAISYASFILFVKKSDDELRFCVDYRKFNAIIKKNQYFISLIAKIIAQLFKAQ